MTGRARALGRPLGERRCRDGAEDGPARKDVAEERNGCRCAVLAHGLFGGEAAASNPSTRRPVDDTTFEAIRIAPVTGPARAQTH